MPAPLHPLRFALVPLLLLGLAYGLSAALDGWVDLASLAMVFVLASVCGALWLPAWGSAVFAVVCVAVFNVAFVPPRGSFSVDLHLHLLLLAGMLIVSTVLSLLMSRLRASAALARQREHEARQREALAETLSAASEPEAMARALQAALEEVAPGRCASLCLKAGLPTLNDDAAAWILGAPDADETAGLWHATREVRAMGPGTTSHDELNAHYLPLRSGEGAAQGAVLLRLDLGEVASSHGAPGGYGEPPVAQVRQLAALAGMALHRCQLESTATQAREEARTQTLRSALLAAISHDFRTPLACILGAASSLDAQFERLAPAQRRTLLAQIENEARALAAIAENTLQLVRLDGGRLALHRDWESLPEMLGTVLGRLRQRHVTLDLPRRVHARVAPELPLVWGDAVLLTQLIENLVDNALKYSDGPVEVLLRADPAGVLLAVRDRGPGVPAAQRERIFEAFERGEPVASGSPDAPARRGAGLGLAVGRAIAKAHGGQLSVRQRGHGGASFELRLPVADKPQPGQPAAEAPAEATP